MKRGPIIFNHPPPSFFQECFKKTGQEQSIISYINPSNEQIEKSQKLISSKDIPPSLNLNLNLLKKDCTMAILPERDKNMTNAGINVKSTPKLKPKSIFNHLARLNLIKRAVETMKQGSSIFLSKMLKKINFQIVGDVACEHFEGKAKVLNKKNKYWLFLLYIYNKFKSQVPKKNKISFKKV